MSAYFPLRNTSFKTLEMDEEKPSCGIFASREEVTALQDEISLMHEDINSLRPSPHRNSTIGRYEENKKPEQAAGSGNVESSGIRRRSMFSASKAPNNGDFDDIDEEGCEEEDVPLCPLDTFTFLAVSHVKSRSFGVGMGVFLMQISALLFVLLDSINFIDKRNPISVPPNVELSVRFVQLIALVIIVLSEHEVHKSLNSLHYGYDEAAVFLYFQKKSKFSWLFSIM